MPSLFTAARALIGTAALLSLCGCQTPERRAVLQRMDRLQIDNSALKARAEAEVAQAKMDSMRQRQQDLLMVEQMNRRFDELNKKIEAIQSQPRSQAPAQPSQPAQPAPVEASKPDPAIQAELERVRAEAQAEMKRMEEELAKAQAKAEAAKLAAQSAEKSPQDAKKDLNLKGRKLPLTKFIDSSGKLVDLGQYIGKNIVVLTVMKGFYSQGICVYCTRQTADFARNQQAFKDAGVEVLVVYPGLEEHINAFVRSVRDYEKSSDPRFQLPFKVLLDVNQDAVRAFNIAGDLAHPTTFIIDKSGTVVYQYVGRTMSDRPTSADILQEVRKLGNTN
ncbi:MAG TPA: redoxin domain-containing protein [Planctomycetota bacterium]|nr:redoxin domain-containing protein [Planctomycetota bacterium]